MVLLSIKGWIDCFTNKVF